MHKDKAVCFTGYRNVIETAELKETLTKQLIKLIDEGAADFFSGGAIGWDMICEKTVIRLREQYPHIKLHLVLPCPATEQTAKWSENDKAEYIKLLSVANTVEVCSEHYFDGCMSIRNKRLVDLSDVCVCYYSGKQRSGTGQTVRIAERQGVTVINIAKD